MIDHMGIRPADIERARQFYDAALKPLGIANVMEVTPDETGGYHGIGYGAGPKPFFWLSSDRRQAALEGPRGAGIHIAFEAGSRAAVDAFYQAALAQGGSDNGAPGIRPHYHPAYYAAFVIDPDGVNVEAVCQKPE
ncbi:MAG: glyoxalase/bleomycin resistance/extradiol dioxygenase family protein [Henriciella sp.]|jgi:catechol 2,3-dioxygenase-like lactoylglutathione lyase family enzyme|uniref:VOC family protein n=1 Tax=Henriciella sp. TaxID=1968823 RepID=UPI000C0E36ED|nr:VOC family protein [Henriciella sp.]MAN73269.1 glyoxalase/bleomycin resistance/extradiol dioxygenase family protein [Henriciella sp.]MBF33352.1 glyoxalase/bleomycin resistance/extradiol dioxygenase family protein [Hyphomonadaceae bacterium]MBK74818.1 glyoxalase/bleomycin resistance/extradiol dioxygenase family protein [Henriciella sp.]PHR79051.1 MAG: glyoxalase/bleomycin resistance/extradiol dioxygenase family protein [Henriciella sp.]|tara:strand:+ start:1370 stop:1777 length:408 start_codon:yes stop_codon:yes gene_type:complete